MHPRKRPYEEEIGFVKSGWVKGPEPPSGRRMRADFLEELKMGSMKGKVAASTEAAVEEPGLDSSNLVVENFHHQECGEEDLIKVFSRFGPLASVKIMWPRTAEDLTFPTTKAYVNFLRAPDAENAYLTLQGKDFTNGSPLILNWSKPTPIPYYPLYVPPEYGEDTAKLLVKRHGVGVNVVVEMERLSKEEKFLIDSVATYTAAYGGVGFEEEIAAREAGNPHYDFLKPALTDKHVYYKWKVYSLLQGDAMKEYRGKPFQLVRNGPMWVPPGVRKGEEGRAVDAKDGLTEGSKQHFFTMLRSLTLRNDSIKEAMMWCVSHSAAARDIVLILADSLSLTETPPSTKLARLYLISDILYNTQSTALKVHLYRDHLATHLPAVFTHLQKYLILNKSLVEPISHLLSIWSRWAVFTEELLLRLRVNAGLKG